MAKGKQAKPQLSPSGGIIKGLSGELSGAIQNQILDPTNVENLTQKAVEGAVSTVRGGYGARGLAGSGIAQKGETEAATDVLLKGTQQQAGNILGVLQAGSGAPSYAPFAPPRGFMGLK